jgi:hypothetical protein
MFLVQGVRIAASLPSGVAPRMIYQTPQESFTNSQEARVTYWRLLRCTKGN